MSNSSEQNLVELIEIEDELFELGGPTKRHWVNISSDGTLALHKPFWIALPSSYISCLRIDDTQQPSRLFADYTDERGNEHHLNLGLISNLHTNRALLDKINIKYNHINK